jgi:DNA-binding NarL/FixJ family response regulator
MSEVKKVLIVDEHPLVGRATKQLLELLDYQLPDQIGTKVAEQIKSHNPDIHIVIFTGKDSSDIYNKLLDVEVSGILSKESNERSIINMVKCILENHTMLPLPLFHRTRLTPKVSTIDLLLNKEEIFIMSMIVKGYKYEQVGETIHTSRRSIDNYLKRIYEKLGVQAKIQAIELFVQSQHYLDIDDLN